MLPVPHSRVSEALNERNGRPKSLNLSLDVLSHGQAARNVLKVLDTLMHCLERTVHIGPQQLRVDVD